MRQLVIGLIVVAGVAAASPAFAYDNFLPLGLGYSTKNIGLYHLSQQDLNAIGQADVYETDIYQRQLHARQYDSQMTRIQNDRNFDPTDFTPNY
jgi:hypothetical protein